MKSDTIEISPKKQSASLVSVIMNCFNGDEYLHEAVDSIISQSYQNWEIIFWDNQSTDSSAKIIKLYNDNRIKYFLAPNHTSLYEARNFAIEKTKGEFIAFLDVDDWWLPAKLEKQVPLFRDSKVGLVYSNFVQRNESTGRDKIAHKRSLPTGYILDNIMSDYPIGLLTIIVRRVAYEQLQTKFNPKYNIIGDFDFCIRLANQWKFMCIQSPTAYYRLHESNLHTNESKLYIEEFRNWLSYHSSNPIIFKNPSFEKLKSNIFRIELMTNIKNGNRKYALKNIFMVSGFENKIKVLVAIILPARVLKFISDRFY